MTLSMEKHWEPKYHLSGAVSFCLLIAEKHSAFGSPE